MTDNQSNPEYRKYTDQPAIQHAIRTMPRWKWKLLGIALVMGCLGVVGQATTYMRTGKQVTISDNKPVTKTLPSSSTGGATIPGGSSGFVGGSPTNTGIAAPTPALPVSTSQQAPTLAEMMTPFMTHVGFSLFVGVIVGLIFRTFLRVAALVTALIAVAVAAAAHFNVDVSAVKAQAAGAESWVSTEGYKLWDLVKSALPSSTAASVGFVFGFKRK